MISVLLIRGLLTNKCVFLYAVPLKYSRRYYQITEKRRIRKPSLKRQSYKEKAHMEGDCFFKQNLEQGWGIEERDRIWKSKGIQEHCTLMQN